MQEDPFKMLQNVMTTYIPTQRLSGHLEVPPLMTDDMRILRQRDVLPHVYGLQTSGIALHTSGTSPRVATNIR